MKTIKRWINNKPQRLVVTKTWYVEAKSADEAIFMAESMDHHTLEVRPDKNWRGK
jgi:hypothetical protein